MRYLLVSLLSLLGSAFGTNTYIGDTFADGQDSTAAGTLVINSADAIDVTGYLHSFTINFFTAPTSATDVTIFLLSTAQTTEPAAGATIDYTVENWFTPTLSTTTGPQTYKLSTGTTGEQETFGAITPTSGTQYYIGVYFASGKLEQDSGSADNHEMDVTVALSSITVASKTVTLTAQPSSTGFTFEFDISSVASTTGDPHFHGFQGQEFTITGKPFSVYNMISDFNFQYNTRFIWYNRVHKFIDSITKTNEKTNVTYVGDVGIKFIDPVSSSEHRFRLSVFNPKFNLSQSVNDFTQDDTAKFLRVQFDDEVIPLSLVANATSKRFEPADSDDIDRTTTITKCDGNCTVRIKNNMVAFGSLNHAFWFYFTIEYNKHNEIFINSKVDFNKRTHVTPSKNVHGLLGQTYRLGVGVVAGGVDDGMGESDLDSDSAHERARAIESINAVESQSKQPHDAVWHRTGRTNTDGKVDFDFVDSKFLKGHLYDYEVQDSDDTDEIQTDKIWGDFFKFNRYYSL